MAGYADIIVATLSSVQAAKQSAQQAKAEAEMLEVEGKAAERLSREQSKRAMAEQRTQIAASGAGIEGSPLTILAESAKQAELEALNLRYSYQARVGARKQEAAYHKKTITPIILGGFAKAGVRTIGMATSASTGSGQIK